MQLQVSTQQTCGLQFPKEGNLQRLARLRSSMRPQRSSLTLSYGYQPSLLTWRYTTSHSKHHLHLRSTLGETEGVPKKLIISTNTSSADWDQGIVYANAQNLARTVSSRLSYPRG